MLHCMDAHFNFLRITLKTQEWPGDEASPAAQSDFVGMLHINFVRQKA